MPARFVNVGRQTPMFLPCDLREWLPAGHIVHFLLDAVEQLPLGRAISYALNQWSTLERLLEHGEVVIDNNLENAIRPTVVGKKNWLFFGSAEAGQRSAVMHTLIANCHLHGVEPSAYLKDVMERQPRATNQEAAQLTPRRWKNAQRCPTANLAA